MLKKFLNRISGRFTSALGADSPDPQPRTEPGPHRYVLVTQRNPDPEAFHPVFGEAYYCQKCRDYFGLAWHPGSSPLALPGEVVPETHPRLKGKGAIGLPVFCPVCQSDYSHYGSVQHPQLIREPPEEAVVYEAFDYPFPPEAPSSADGCLKLGNLLIEKIVLLVTGEVPAGMDLRDFAYDGVHDVIFRQFGGQVSISEGCGIRLHVLRVSTIVDETEWLMPVLKRHVYQTSSWGTKMFLTNGVTELRPPLRQCLFCLVMADDSHSPAGQGRGNEEVSA